MPGPVARLGYAWKASAAASRAVHYLTPASKRCLDAAQAQSRGLDDNHVGTEHIALGVLASDREVAGKLAGVGVTVGLFRAQLFDEPGPSEFVGGRGDGSCWPPSTPSPAIPAPPATTARTCGCRCKPACGEQRTDYIDIYWVCGGDCWGQ